MSVEGRKRKLSLSLYVIINADTVENSKLLELTRKAIKGGATFLQYRSKKKTTMEMFKEAFLIRKLTKKYKVPFVVNDRLDVALGIGADGVHLGQKDLPPEIARKVAGRNFIIGISTHTLEEAIVSSKKPVDYISFGPIFPTRSKENHEIPTGIAALCRVVKCVSLPVVAVGGINEENLDSIMSCSPAGVAVISAVFGKGDPEKNAQRLRRRIEELRESGG